MKTIVAALSLAFTLICGAALAALKPGEAAPDFTLQAAQGGKDFSFSLKEALKKGPVVLYFYPKSFTKVCTIEAHEFAEAMEQFAAMGASVIGVSADRLETQREFSSKECRDKFPVGADPAAIRAQVRVVLKGSSRSVNSRRKSVGTNFPSAPIPTSR
jgi:peroxiredoxin